MTRVSRRTFLALPVLAVAPPPDGMPALADDKGNFATFSCSTVTPQFAAARGSLCQTIDGLYVMTAAGWEKVNTRS